MTSQSFNSELFRHFPQLKAIADKEFDYFEDEEPGCYIIFEGVLVPEIDRAASARETEYLKRLMNFVEEVACGDQSCRNLVGIGLGEWIPSSINALSIYRMAGPMTKKVIPVI